MFARLATIYGLGRTAIRRSAVTTKDDIDDGEDGRVLPWIGVSSPMLLVIVTTMATSNGNLGGLSSGGHFLAVAVLGKLLRLCETISIDVHACCPLFGHLGCGVKSSIVCSEGPIVRIDIVQAILNLKPLHDMCTSAHVSGQLRKAWGT